MATKEKERFNPIEKACADSFDSGWLGDKHFNIQKFALICERRGLVEDVWTEEELSLPLRLFEKESRKMEEEKVDALLNDFADIVDFDLNIIKRHYYAIKFDHEDQFLGKLKRQKKKRENPEELSEEAENLPEFNDEDAEETDTE